MFLFAIFSDIKASTRLTQKLKKPVAKDGKLRCKADLHKKIPYGNANSVREKNE